MDVHPVRPLHQQADACVCNDNQDAQRHDHLGEKPLFRGLLSFGGVVGVQEGFQLREQLFLFLFGQIAHLAFTLWSSARQAPDTGLHQCG